MYAMQSLWLPQSVCDYMDKTIRQFLWSKDGHSRGWSMVSWKDVTKSKYKGGLGIRLARDANVALLGKVVAGFVEDHDKFWVTILSHKYLKGNSILSVGVRAGDSYIWRGIIKAKDVLKDGISVRLGQGLSSLWFTDWLGTGKLCDRVPYVHVADSDLLVSNVWTNNEWNLSSLYTSILEVVINEI